MAFSLGSCTSEEVVRQPTPPPITTTTVVRRTTTTTTTNQPMLGIPAQYRPGFIRSPLSHQTPGDRRARNAFRNGDRRSIFRSNNPCPLICAPPVAAAAALTIRDTSVDSYNLVMQVSPIEWRTGPSGESIGFVGVNAGFTISRA